MLRRSAGFWGTLCVLGAASGFGTTPMFSRLAFEDGLTVSVVVFFRYFLPCLVFSYCFLGLLRRWKHAFPFFACGAAMAVGTYGYAIGIRDMDIAMAAIIFFSFPIFVTLFKFLLFKSRPSGVEYITLGLILAAVALVAGPVDLEQVPLSSLLITFTAPAAYASVLLVVSIPTNQLLPIQSTALISLGGLVGSILLIWIKGIGFALPQTQSGWMSAMGLALIATLLPNLLLSLGAARAGPLRTAIAGTFELPVTLCLGWAVIAEPVQLNQVGGSILIILALALSVHATREKAELPD
ncbi:DMT family transporter [Pseudovibrio brasiliensis]|nr:DMT family transporter [Pseudovibrio brasiliensis]